MLEIFALIAATTAITAFARGRGGSPWAVICEACQQPFAGKN
jgi:hypothetical protein